MKTEMITVPPNYPDGDDLDMGGAAIQGGTFRMYRDILGNVQAYINPGAAANEIAMSVYGGVVAQNYLTVGQAVLNTSTALYLTGAGRITSNLRVDATISCNKYTPIGQNAPGFRTDIIISGTDSTVHTNKMQIDANDIIVAQATGNGSGGITNKAIGLYGTTPTTQAAHIADPAENVAANNAAIDAILVALENIGITASS